MLKKFSAIIVSSLLVFNISLNTLASQTEEKFNKTSEFKVYEVNRFKNNSKIDAECKQKDLHRKNPVAKNDREISKKLDEYLNACVNYNNFHGSVLVQKEGRIILKKGYGMADVENNIPNKSNTRFAIASMTKPFTAMAIMQLYERGMLKLDDKLSKYIPDFKRGDEITIHDLLTHTSGVTNYTMLPEFWDMDPETFTTEKIVSFIKDKPLEFKPGESYNYSNSGYVLLGYIVEEITGKSLEKYLQKNIFNPLKMKDTGVSYKNGNKMFDAVGYDGYMDITPIDDSFSLKGLFGAGNLYSTIEDLNLWERAISSGKLVKRKTMELIFTPHVKMTEKVFYGYGWVISDEGTDKEIYHDGSVPGFSSIISRFVDKDTSIILLSNNSTAGSDIYQIKRDINSLLNGQEVEFPTEKKAIILDADTLASLTGTYEIVPNVNFTISSEGEHLYAQLTGQDKFEIFAKSGTEFFYKIVKADITFVKDEKGQTMSLILHQLGVEIPAQKILNSSIEVIQPAA